MNKKLTIDQCENLFDYFDEQYKEKIRRYIEHPSEPLWEQIYNIIIDGKSGTVWNAWRSVDKNAPDSKGGAGWSSYPDPFTLYRAIAEFTGTKKAPKK